MKFLNKILLPDPLDPNGAFPARPSLTRSDPALIDSITPPLYYITSPFTNLKQRRARLGLRPCQRGETLTRSSKKVKEGEERKGGIEKSERDRLNCRKCLRRWGELEDRREEGEKGENRKSIGRQSRRMKIEGWCGWDLGAGEEVAFKRDCRVAWALTVMAIAENGVMKETPGQGSSSPRWPSSLQRRSEGSWGLWFYVRLKLSRFLLLRPVHFVFPLIWNCVSKTNNTPSSWLCTTKRRTFTLSVIFFFKRQRK